MRTCPILQRATLMAAALVAASAAPADAQSDVLVELRDFTPREHRAEAFVLLAPATLRVEAVGAEPANERRGWLDRLLGRDEPREDTWPGAAWILDARSRQVVWDLRASETRRSGNGLRHFDGEVRLPPGVYLAHYASFPATAVMSSANGDVRSILRSARAREVRFAGPYVDDGAYRAFRLAVRGAGRRATPADVAEAARAFTQTAVVSVRPIPGEAARSGLELARPAEVEVYAIGELDQDGAHDYAWIADAVSGARVWQMDYAGSDHAGGALKNRVTRTRVTLPAGRYVAYFAADDSHDPDAWNAVPPVDPDFWGLTLRIADAGARAAVEPFAYEPVPAGQTIVSLVGVGDDELRSQGFTLRRPMDVRVYALGEGRDGEMFDYAWIVDATTRQRVWTMRHADTEHAGGTEKNRLSQSAFRLEAGSYLVYYRSDGSHSAAEWNGGPPAEQRYWGVSLFPASGHLDREAVAAFTGADRRAAGLLAEIVRVGDDERARATFRIARETAVRIHALGEGDGEMYDYAWLEDVRTGQVLWEMTYGATEHAGGARKNRLYDGRLTLRPGEYVLRYQSDGSHSYGAWNADPPDDPEGWGVTLFRVG